RAVGVDVDPHLAAALDVPRHGDTSGLDLPVRDVGRLDGLDAEVAEGELGATLGRAGALGVVLLAVLDPAGHQHGAQASPLVAVGVVVSAAGAAAGSAAGAAAVSVG